MSGYGRPGDWPATDVIGDVRIDAADRGCVAATDFYFVGGRDFVHSTTLLLAADLLVENLLDEGEAVTRLELATVRRRTDRNLILTASTDGAGRRRLDTEAFQATYLTTKGRSVRVEGHLGGEAVRRREKPWRALGETLDGMHLEDAVAGVQGTRIDPLRPPFDSCPSPAIARCMEIEIVLEATRRRIRERFGSADGDGLVVAGLRRFAFSTWEQLAGGFRIDYRLREGRLANGTQLLHCDLSSDARLTIARAPSKAP